MLAGTLLSTAPVFAATPLPATPKPLFLPLITGGTAPSRGPITGDECNHIGGKLTAQSYENGTRFIAIDKMRAYIPHATGDLNASFFPTGEINSLTGQSPVCYFPGDYMTVWPNPLAPLADSDVTWFTDHPDQVRYLDIPGGRPELGDFGVAASAQLTSTLYTMMIAPALNAIEDIPVIGNIRIGGTAGKAIFQIGEVGAGRIASVVEGGGYAYVISLFLDKIWKDMTEGSDVGVAALRHNAFFIPKTKSDVVGVPVYIGYYADVVSAFGNSPVGKNIGMVVPDGDKNWGWLITNTPQYKDQHSYALDNVIDFMAIELLDVKQDQVPADDKTLEQQLDELNDLANERLGKKGIPATPGFNCPPQVDRLVIEESLDWIVMFSSIKGNAQLTQERVLFFMEYVTVAFQIAFEPRYQTPAPWVPGNVGQEYALNQVFGKTWAVYSMCSMLGWSKIAQPRFTFAPYVGGDWGFSNDKDNPKQHLKFPFE
ncbi:hypothetical protein BH09PAT2_BH09PAT2_02990 [soil metagenome]